MRPLPPITASSTHASFAASAKLAAAFSIHTSFAASAKLATSGAVAIAVAIAACRIVEHWTAGQSLLGLQWWRLRRDDTPTLERLALRVLSAVRAAGPR